MTGPYSPISASFSAAAHADERASEAFPADGEALSEQLRRGVYGSLAGRLMAESPVAEVAHLVLAGMASVLVFPWVPRLQVVLWASSIAVAALARRRLRAAEHLLAESRKRSCGASGSVSPCWDSPGGSAHSCSDRRSPPSPWDGSPFSSPGYAPVPPCLCSPIRRPSTSLSPFFSAA